VDGPPYFGAVPAAALEDVKMPDAIDSDSGSQFGLSAEFRRLVIVQFWSEIDTTGDFGAADGGVMDSIKRGVTEAMGSIPENLDEAESLTHRAFLLYTSNIDC
jgi:hypothetical protein